MDLQGCHMSSTVGEEGPQKVVAGAMPEPKRKQPLEGQNRRRRSDRRSRKNCFAGQTCARQHHGPKSSINHGMFTRTHSPLSSFRYHRSRPTLELGCCFTTLLITFWQPGTVAPSSPSWLILAPWSRRYVGASKFPLSTECSTCIFLPGTQLC